jgi:octaprenyl-diphosphate synthase
MSSKLFESTAKRELITYKNHYREAIKSKTRLLDIISNFVHQKKENKTIPLTILLSARACGELTPATYQAAIIIDLLYTATRIHDDVEDEIISGKGFFKINAIWKEKLSVLMGDYFLAKGLLLSVKNKNYDLLEIFSKSVKEITEGELRIKYNSSNLIISIKEYLEIAQQKSSSLYSACALAGALSVGGSKSSQKIITSFGRNFGMALYIKNDLNFEKTIINDRYRLTLPLIFALKNASEEESIKIIRYLQFPVKANISNYIQLFTEQKEGVQKSVRLMEDYKMKAIDDITEFPYSEQIENLKQLVNSTFIPY